jgi:hypothetical protein
MVLHGAGDVGHRHAELGGALAVDGDVALGSIELEVDVDEAQHRADADAVDAVDQLLERLGDLRRDHRWTGAGVVGAYRHDRRIDRGILAHAEEEERDDAEGNDDQRQDDRQHRPADAGFREFH